MTRPLAAALVCVLLTAACAASPAGTADRPPTGDATAAVGDGLTVVATVFPLGWIATQVAPGAEVAFLGSSGQDPHDLEMSPADRELVETADVLLYMGDLDFQPQVEEAVASAPGVTVAVADIAGDAHRLDAEHAPDDEHGHDDGTVDPHLWFDGHVMADVAEHIGETFAGADPDGAADYTANATRVAEELRDLEVEIDALLQSCRHDTAVVSHAAYAYLLEPRGLHQEGISGTGGHADATPQRLAELTAHVREEGIEAVAADPVEGRADAEALAHEAGVELVEIQTLEVVTDDQAGAGYPALLREQAEGFADVLGCG